MIEIEPPRRRRPIWKRFLFALVCLLATLGIAELGVRLAGLGPRVYVPRRFLPAGVPFTFIKEGSISFPVYQPNVVFSSAYDPIGDDRGYLKPDGKVAYRINSSGFRGGPLVIEKPPAAFRVLCLGDSLTFGEGVHEEDTYPARLENLLRGSLKGRTVQVINAGVQGYGTREEVALFFDRCAKLQPDVVFLGFFLNDATPFGETVRQNDERSRELPLSGLARISKIWETIERRKRAASLQNEYFETTRRSFDTEAWQIAKQLLAMMQAESKKSGFRFVVVLLPMMWGLDGDYPFEGLHARIADACRSAGCEIIDLLPVFRGRRPESLWVHPIDQHPNEIAHELIARSLAEALGPNP
ncbi:MAG TPA: SGNH/GDSL hydrolase family protein [Phycisphaerae bacterium]|nr:SGNH/GDSL hydrolase family protein [Phycisphaerae bacterium]